MPVEHWARHYAALRAAAASALFAADAHAFASTLALALVEAEATQRPPVDGLGLSPSELGHLIDRMFPTVGRAGFRLDRHDGRPADEEELLIRDLLDAHRRRDDAVAGWLAAIIARRAMRPDHLWQDLGLQNRSELNALLARHFPALHAGNVRNMRWKKYFYRRICESEGFALCTAPSCAACCDFSDCFGEETGLSQLARARLELASGA